jgi:hypothetical protein
MRIRYPSPNNSTESSFPTIKYFLDTENKMQIAVDNNIDVSDKKILVLSLVNNCGSSIYYIDKFMQEMSEVFKNIKFSFFSNNNRDKTYDILNSLEQKYKNNLYVIKHSDEILSIENRIEKFAEYRNINFIEAINKFGKDFDYLIVFDSDLSDTIPVLPIIDSLKIENVEWSCITGNHCYKNSSYYYDALALRSIADPVDIKDNYKNFDIFYGKSEKWIDQLLTINDWEKVKSAFGGVAIYKMPEILDIFYTYGNLYNIRELPQYTAEHIALNLKLDKDILINPNIRYTNSTNIEGKMYANPIAFIPRDAGFFSVFNFYIGYLTLGGRAYPWFSKQELLNLNNNVNEHFCYWTENENCWFDYFEPVKFFHNDTCHIDNTYKSFTKHRGETAPAEFRIPDDTKKLIQDEDRFNNWRHTIHGFYKQYIKYNQKILEKTETFWNNNIAASNVIGVHYRHPSHFIESGKIYLEDYFNKIDDILLEKPDAQIFLATDSNFGIYAFKEKYAEKVVYIKDVERLSMPEFLHWCFSLAEGRADHVGFINGKGFELHHKRVKNNDNYKLTTDLLCEVLCLSKCDYLIHTTSNVALAISYMNPNLKLISL